MLRTSAYVLWDRNRNANGMAADAELEAMTKPIQFTFDPSAREDLEQIQAAAGVADLGTVLRRAVGLYKWALETRKQGYSIGAFAVDMPVLEIDIDKFGE